MTVAVPNVIGLGRTVAEERLDSLLLRHIAKFPFSATGDGTATEQSPAAGATVPQFSIVTVSYPTPLGPLDDSPVEGPSLTGTFEGRITSVQVGPNGAAVGFVTSIDGADESFSIALYDDNQTGPLLPRTVWMRRGAMLSLAQRAFSSHAQVRLNVSDVTVQSIELFEP